MFYKFVVFYPHTLAAASRIVAGQYGDGMSVKEYSKGFFYGSAGQYGDGVSAEEYSSGFKHD